jgi:hypothetical protein
MMAREFFQIYPNLKKIKCFSKHLEFLVFFEEWFLRCVKQALVYGLLSGKNSA